MASTTTAPDSAAASSATAMGILPLAEKNSRRTSRVFCAMKIDQRHAEEHGDRDRPPTPRRYECGESLLRALRGEASCADDRRTGAGDALAVVRGGFVVLTRRTSLTVKRNSSLVEVMGFEPTASTLRT